jgi:hypothetical protein
VKNDARASTFDGAGCGRRLSPGWHHPGDHQELTRMPDTRKPRVLIETDDDTDDKAVDTTALTAGLIGDDILTNAAEIALYLYGKSDKKTTRRVYSELAQGYWPHWKRGNGICASKQALAEHYRKMTGRK